MITRQIPRPHICLNCQRRLARQSTPSRIQNAFQSTDAAPEETERSDPTKQVRRTLVPLSHFAGSNPIKHAYRRYRPVEEQLGDFYGFRGHSLVKESESIDAKNLGDPAEIVVLRESKIHRYDSRIPGYGTSLEDPIVPESVDILGRLDEERGVVGKNQVRKNIESFRPKKGQEPKGWDEINAFVKEIQDAFTVPQIETYIREFEIQKISEEASEESSTDEPSSIEKIVIQPPLGDAKIINKGDWRPEFWDLVDLDGKRHLYGRALASHTTKQRHIVRLMTQCWGIEMPESSGGLGTMDIELHPSDLELLSKHMVLDALREDYMIRLGERLERVPELTNTVRITATEKKCEIVIQQLEQVLGNIERVELSLVSLMPALDAKPSNKQMERWTDAHFTDESLRELARLTNTEIARLPEHITAVDNKPKRLILISCLTSRSDVWLSNRASIARRMLIRSGNFSKREQYRMAAKIPDTTPIDRAIFSKYETVQGLAWRDRLREWFRWTLPIPKDEAPEPVADDMPNEHGIEEPEAKQPTSYLDVPVRVKPKKHAKVSPGTAYWDDQYMTNSSAIIGSVLHSHPEGEKFPHDPFTVNQTTRTFSTALPHLSNVLKSAELEGGKVLHRETLVLHFQPNPFSQGWKETKLFGTSILSAFPPLEFHLRVDDNTKELKLVSVRATVREDGTDLMMPQHAVDVRFHQKTSSRLRRDLFQSPEILSFFSKSNLTYHDRRLDLPPALRIKIAKHLCSLPDLKKLPMDPKAELHDVEYMFVGREAKREMLFSYQDWRLSYSHYDAGESGGRRSELALHPIRVSGEGTQEEFVDSVYDLVESFGTGTYAPSATLRKVPVGPDLTRLIVMRKKKANAKPVPKVFTHFAKRLDLMDEWWNHSREVGEGDIEAEGFSGQEDPAMETEQN